MPEADLQPRKQDGAGLAPASGVPDPLPPGASSALARNIPVMAITTAMNVGSMMLWMPVLSLILRDLGASDLVISTASACWLVFSAMFQYWGGRLTDRLGRVPVMVWPGLLSAVSIAACAAATRWQVFVVLYALYNTGHALQGPVFASIVGESVPAARRGQAFAVIEFGIGIGVIIGPLLGAVLMPLVGVRGLLILSGIILAAAAGLRQMYLRETRARNAVQAHFAIGHLFAPRLARVLLILICFNVLLALTVWGPFLSLHASDAMGLDKPAINRLAAMGSAAGVLISFVAGRAVGRWGAQPILSGGFIGLAVTALLWSLQRTSPAIIVTYILMNMAFQVTMISSDTFRVHQVDEEIRGRALGAMGMITSLMTAPVVPIIGWLRTTVGSGVPFYATLIPAAIGVWALAKLAQQHGQTHGHGHAVPVAESGVAT
ncbi:MAG: MFS transporter [Bacillota bacterium]|nr:MFS transporter [Bacillota bacterium]